MQKYLSDVEIWLNRLYIAAEGATLRREDHRKAYEVAAMLEEVELAISRFSNRKPLLLVDAAAGKSYVGLLAAKLILAPRRRPSSVTTMEKDPQRVASSSRAVERLETSIPVNCIRADVANHSAWPAQPSIVTALHACGSAADTIIDRAIACQAGMLLLVPCCTGKSVPAFVPANTHARRLGIPRHALVRRRFIQALVDSERTLRLEAAGYETEVVEFVAPTVTPHNFLWRARLVGEPRRMAVAQKTWTHLSSLNDDVPV